MGEEIIILPIDICRICANLQSHLNILNEKLEGEQVLLHEALEFVSCIRVDFNDGMSRTICSACSKKLLDAYKFKNQVLDSYRIFFNQTSDIKFQNINSLPNNKVKETKSSIHKEKSAFFEERAKELGINLSSDAVSFILEQSSNKDQKSENEQNIQAIKDHFIENEVEIKKKNNEVEILNAYLGDNETVAQNGESPVKVEYSEENEPPPDATPEKRRKNLTKKQVFTSPFKFLCILCHKIFARKSNFFDHIRSHTNEKRFVCRFCNKAFVQIANYRTHLRVHTKERSFQCNFCPKAFSQSGSLKIHIRSHNNERNYICEICSKCFTNPAAYSRHKKIHDITGQFSCEICGHQFSQRSNLRVHERNVHCLKKRK